LLEVLTFRKPLKTGEWWCCPNAGTEILVVGTIDVKLASLPVNVTQDHFAFLFRVLLVYILHHPVNKVILECPFDKLV